MYNVGDNVCLRGKPQMSMVIIGVNYDGVRYVYDIAWASNYCAGKLTNIPHEALSIQDKYVPE